MGKGSGFFQNRRVYLLTTVAYLGSFLFGQSPDSSPKATSTLTGP